MHVRKPIKAALEFVGELGVVNAHEVQDGRLQVVNVDRVAGDVVSEVVGRAVADSGTNATAREEHAEAARVMVAAIVGRGELPLRIVGAAEFASPNYQRVVEQSAL